MERGKPAPDCFYATAAKIGVAPEECLVIEDAPTGVQAATAAGMRVVVVPSLTDKEGYPAADPEARAGSASSLARAPDSQMSQPALCMQSSTWRDHASCPHRLYCSVPAR